MRVILFNLVLLVVEILYAIVVSLRFIAYVAVACRPLQLHNLAESRQRQLQLCCPRHLLPDGTASW